MKRPEKWVNNYYLDEIEHEFYNLVKEYPHEKNKRFT